MLIEVTSGHPICWHGVRSGPADIGRDRPWSPDLMRDASGLTRINFFRHATDLGAFPSPTGFFAQVVDFGTHFLDRLRSTIINSTLNFELLCKAPAGRGRG